jgi:hypothetical protein
MARRLRVIDGVDDGSVPVAQVSKIDRAPQMRVAVRIAAGTLEWTFPSDLDG